jgi:myo-inositol-1(or 4)-monophosphatase
VTSTPQRPSEPAAREAGRWPAELAAASAIAERAGALLVEHLDDSLAIAYKGLRDIVTEVDHAAEALIRAELAARFPADGFFGEECGAPDEATRRTWVCDPLDGTINYANGIPFFCVSLALVEGGVPVVGVIHDPLRGETFRATADGPATLEGRAIRASTKERLIDLVMALAISGRAPGTRLRRVRRAIRVPRQMGSSALSLVYVANGRFDAFSQTTGLSTWDVAAAGLIAERAGALVTDMAGGPWFDLAAGTRALGLLAAPPGHHGSLLELLREP